MALASEHLEINFQPDLTSFFQKYTKQIIERHQ